jgi:hypothetical protein
MARRILDRRAIGVASAPRLDGGAMAKIKTPKPPEHRTDPRRSPPKSPPLPVKRVPLWTRAVPPDRSFPRA